MRNDVTVLTAQAVADMIPDGATIALTGSGIFLEPDDLLIAIESRFLNTGHPRDLTIVHGLGIGDGKDSGLNRLAYEGMVRRVIGGHWTWSPTMQKLAATERLEAYSFPAGVIQTLLRESGAGRPGVITRTGLGTFADPRVAGGRCNASAKDDLVDVVTFDGEEYLRYKPLKIDISLIRGTEADTKGNICMRREPTDLDIYTLALAAHNTGGRVYAQVERVRPGRIIPSRLVRVPGIIVDAVIPVPEPRLTYLPGYDPSISGEAPSEDRTPTDPILPTGIRRKIAERALKELGDHRSVNFGFGIPGGIPALLRHAGHADYWGTIEQGIHNGEMIDGPMFGAARDPDAIVPSTDQFDFYSGGGIEIAFLGMGEMDAQGNVNVSMIDGKLVGPGGFVDITQNASKVVFCGTFEAKGLRVTLLDDGGIRIDAPGAIAKLVPAVDHITFSGTQARKTGQEVIYVTERAVFRLGDTGIELIEVTPGVDLQADILDRMGFAPVVKL